MDVWEEIAEEVFARKLMRIVPRLEMLGFTLQSARDEYEALVAEAISLANSDQETEGKANYLSFNELYLFRGRDGSPRTPALLNP